MSRLKLVLAVFVALIVCLGFGFVWGASGRQAIESALDESRQQIDLAEARGSILDGRVSLYNNNFGDASRHFEEAKEPLRRVKARAADAGRRDAAASMDAALAQLEEAQRLANKLDSGANAKAGAALDAIKAAHF